MNFAAQMRIGSLEIVLALAAFAIVVGRSRFGASPRPALDVQIELAIGNDVVGFTISEGHPPRVIGRSPQGDVVLSDAEVSRRHAALQAAGGAVYLTDLGSRNGTFLNGRRLADEGIELKDGDHIDVGNTRIEVTSVRPVPWT